METFTTLYSQRSKCCFYKTNATKTRVKIQQNVSRFKEPQIKHLTIFDVF